MTPQHDFDALIVRVCHTYHGEHEATVQITPPTYSPLRKWQAALMVLPPIENKVETDQPTDQPDASCVAIGLGNDSTAALVSLARLVGLHVKEF